MVRYYVEQRDGSVCSRCGINTDWIAKRISEVRHRGRAKQDAFFKKHVPDNPQRGYPMAHLGHCYDQHIFRHAPKFVEYKEKIALWRSYVNRQHEIYNRLLRRIGLSVGDLTKSLWEAHHITAVKEGGGGCGMDGLETLCIWCHKKESAAQQAKWAKERRIKTTGQVELF
jgi:hypothetical protein